jgi:hypothetical protein
MANYPGTPNNDNLQGTIADDLYTDLGVGVDTVKDPGGKNTIDISSATTGATVDLSPGKTSTLGTGSFTLGSLIVGDNPDVVFVADVSGSTSSIATGVAVGDLNGDGSSNTILDGEIAGFIALNQSLIDRGLGDTARVSLVAFESAALQVGTTVTPKTDANNNGIFDIVESLKTLRALGGTDYETGLKSAQAVFTKLGTPSGKGNLVFLSDGVPDSTTSYLDEVAALKTSGYNLKAFGVGTGAALPPLAAIDPSASIFTTTTQLVNAFSLTGSSGSTTETSIDNFIGTKFADTINGNSLSNNIQAGAGDDIIAGVNPNATTPGKGEIDTLTGGTGKDTFGLGDTSKVYYDDGAVTTPGITDYALITDFNVAEGDIVKLNGLANQYSLGTSPITGVNGQALFLNKPTGEPSELIAIFKDSAGLTIDSILGILPVITIAKGVDAAEPSTNGSFILNRTGDTAAELTVNLVLPTGTATSGIDYQLTGASGLDTIPGAAATILSTTVKFAAGSNTATVTVSTIDDTLVEGTETISLALATGTGYTLGATTSAIVNLADNDVAAIVLPMITLAKGVDAAEPNTVGSFNLTRTGDVTVALTVNLDVPTGTATSGTDYTALATTATFAAGSATATINITPIDDTLVEGTETIGLALKTGTAYTLGTTTSASINIADNDLAPPVVVPPVEEHHHPEIKCSPDKSSFKFTKLEHGAAKKNEVCAFTVDDADGKINGMKPGDRGYLAAAIDRSQVIFSSLSEGQIDRQFDRDANRHMNFQPTDRLEFLMVEDDTLESVKDDLAKGKSTAKVLFSIDEANADNSNQAKFTTLADNGGYQIEWEDTTTSSDKDFNDLVLKVENLNNSTVPAGTGLQGKAEGCTIDFSSFAGRDLKVDISTTSDAAYNNYIGFYAVTDDKGTLANGLKPGDAGYAEAAIKGVMLSCFKTETKTDLTVAGGQIYAPVVIANGNFDDFLKPENVKNDANSNVHAYFNYIGANTDKVDHFRLLGDNKFGVEDIYGGGDRDYNDVVFQMKVK